MAGLGDGACGPDLSSKWKSWVATFAGFRSKGASGPRAMSGSSLDRREGDRRAPHDTLARVERRRLQRRRRLHGEQELNKSAGPWSTLRTERKGGAPQNVPIASYPNVGQF